MSKLKLTLAGGVAAITALSLLLSKTSYKVLRVIDGDTFETQSHQLIRINGIDAPELKLCGGEEAKKALQFLIGNKSVYLKVWYRDQYMRLISDVYTKKLDVGKALIANGLADNVSQYGDNSERMKLAEKAKDNKIGIWSEKCTQTENLKNPKCNIKGNMRVGGDEKFYHYPGCGQYNNTIVQLHQGDMWFCSEAEAKKLGFAKGKDCAN